MARDRRVVITGMGTVNPLGLDIESTWDGILKSRSGVSHITLFNAETFPTRIAGEVKGFDIKRYMPEKDMYLLDFMCRAARYGVAAAQMSVESACLNLDEINPARFGVSIGTGEEHASLSQFDNIFGGENVYRSFVSNKYFTERYNHLGKIWPIRRNANMISSILSIMFNAQGPNNTSVTACSSSGHAIGRAMRFIESGDADIMLTGGCEGLISEFTIAGFGLLGALATNNESPEKASRPFDLKRNGFVLADGAGMLVIEELSHAKKRGARILAELTGFGSSSNAYRITDSPLDGEGAALAITWALNDSKKTIEQIDHINAHGTSTLLNDKCETTSIKRVFGRRAYEIPISSNKSMLGHTIAASASIELIISILTIKHNLIPPTINLEYPDPDCDLDYVPNIPREKRVDVVLSNSFAFGGQNVSLIVERFKE